MDEESVSENGETILRILTSDLKNHYYQIVFSHVNPKDCFNSKHNVYYLVDENIFFQGSKLKKKLMEDGLSVVSVSGYDRPHNATPMDTVRSDAYFYLLEKVNEIREEYHLDPLIKPISAESFFREKHDSSSKHPAKLFPRVLIGSFRECKERQKAAFDVALDLTTAIKKYRQDHIFFRVDYFMENKPLLSQTKEFVNERLGTIMSAESKSSFTEVDESVDERKKTAAAIKELISFKIAPIIEEISQEIAAIFFEKEQNKHSSKISSSISVA